MTTSYYFNLLRSSFENAFGDINVVDSLSNLGISSKNDVFIVGSVIDAFKLYLKGKKRIVAWVQGVIPEESYMSRASLLRKRILEMIEKYVLKRLTFVIFVSESMKLHYEKKYRIQFQNNYYIIPCFNESSVNREAFFYPSKYDNNVFTYVGSLHKWQCFPETVELYREIEERTNYNTHLLVLTPNVEEAKTIISRKGLKSFEVKYVKQIDLSSELCKAKFGFVIRKDNVVNKVSTPTKLSTYLANGVIPIFTNNITDFSKLSEKLTYVLGIEEFNLEKTINIVMRKMSERILAEHVFEEYSNVFQTYYNTELHVNNLEMMIQDVFRDKP